MRKRQGFTLIEILLVIGIIVLLAGAIIVAINPGRQFAKARNTQRVTDTNAILSAIVQNMTDNQGRWNCAGSTNYSTTLPTSTVAIVSTNEANAGEIDLRCLAPNYIPRLPIDPSLPTGSTSTGYTLQYATSSGRITICAPNAELGETICTTR
jgi:prepilin-type N-terminal cleavage/methylation domain-containing protein